jgi:methyltransferase
VYYLLILAVGVERLVELVISKRHAAWALAHGGREHGRSHYPYMVAIHTALLIGCVVEVWALDRPFLPWLGWPMLAVVVLSQALRYWCIVTLGRRWNTLVIVLPGVPLVKKGPYRFLKHPNYVAVVAEGIALPLVHSAWITALLFTVANAAVLAVRINVENAALRTAQAHV